MSKRSAITKLQAILLIDLIIVSLAAVGYFYLEPQFASSSPTDPRGEPAEFQVTDLTINPPEVEAGQPVVVSANVTNVGEATGEYMLALEINGEIVEESTGTLAGGESATLEFTVTRTNAGTYSVKLDATEGTFTVVASPSNGGIGGKPAAITARNLVINPIEAWPGESVRISGEFTNYGDVTGFSTVSLRINGEVVDNKQIELAGGQTTRVEFTITAGGLGSYSVRLSSLSGTLAVVPQGMHTLTIRTAYTGVEFTVDGSGEVTQYSKLLSAGTHTIAMPAVDPTGEFIFQKWNDENRNPTRTVSLTKALSFFVYYSGGSSCPSLYFWNGKSYTYIAEVSNHGWLGYINYVTGNPDWPIAYWRNNPWDYIPLDKTQLQPRNGYYDMTLTQRWNEIFYLDAAYMLVVDHPSDVNIYSTMVEQYLDPAYMGKIYTVSKNPLAPISAVNEKGENVLFHISKLDGIFTPGTNGPNSPAWNNILWNRLTLDLGDLSNAPQIKLVINGMVDWGSADDYNIWIDQFFAPDVPPGTQITPAPYMEVKDANGNWVRVPEDRQIPIPPEVPRTFVVDLTGLFPTNDYSLRISNFWNVTFDYIGVDTSPQETVSIQRIDPQANLHQAFSSPSAASGKFTRYGDVTELLLNADDMFVIGRQGDEVSLLFPADDLAPPTEGMQRDFFLFVADWFKDEYGNWGYGFDFTVDPMPFQGMSGFPYQLDTEHYPDDDAHLKYLEEWNTRVITASQPQALTSYLATWIIAVVALVTAVDLSVLVYFRRHIR